MEADDHLVLFPSADTDGVSDSGEPAVQVAAHGHVFGVYARVPVLDGFGYPVRNLGLVLAVDVAGLAVNLVLAHDSAILARIYGPAALDSSPLLAQCVLPTLKLSNRLSTRQQVVGEP